MYLAYNIGHSSTSNNVTEKLAVQMHKDMKYNTSFLFSAICEF